MDIICDDIGDGQLLNELKRRFADREKALKDIKAVSRKLEKLNVKLKESEDLKSNFLSNIRNEINNPLASIVGLAGQMADGSVEIDEFKNVAHMIYLEAFELDFQLKNVFVAAELEAGDTELGHALINIGTFVEKTIDTFHHITELKNIKTTITCKDNACKGGEDVFFTDPEKLHMILLNLISNALEFSSDDSEVSILVWRDKEQLLISVEDRGPGISKSDQSVIFDRFKQLSSGSRKSHKGHGLGLCIIKSLLDILDGSISISSTVGKGSTFTISVPELPSKDSAEVYSEDGNEFIFDDDAEVQKF